MKRLLIILTCLIFTSPLHATEYNFPTLTGRVVDTANQIPDDKEKILSEELREFTKKSGHQFVVVTVPSLNDIPAYEYAQQLGRHWGIGRKDIDDGILLLQSPGDGTPGSADVYIASGGGMEYILTDAALSNVIRNTIFPIVKQDKPRSETWPDAILAGAREVMRLGSITKEQKEEFDRKEKELRDKQLKEARASFGKFIGWVFLLSLIGIIAYFVYLFATRKARAERKEQIRLKKIETDKKNKEIQDRYNEILRQERERLKAQELQRQKDRENMLAAMSPADRDIFLAKEKQKADRAREEKRLRDEAAAREAQRQQEERIAAAQKQAEDDRRSGNDDGFIFGGFSAGSDNSASDRSSDDDDNFKGEGGDFFGGGAGGRL